MAQQRNFSLNVDQAREAGSSQFAERITEAGEYIGTITKAALVEPPFGGWALELAILTDGGGSADYLQLTIEDKDGKEQFGTKQISTLLACARLRGMKEGRIKFEKWNKDAKTLEEVETDGYPDLMGKRVGFLLRKKLYTSTKQDNSGSFDRAQMIIMAFFEASTGFTATEILDKATKPEQKDKAALWLAKNPIKDMRKPAPMHSQHTIQSGQKGASGHTHTFDNFDDDIPF